MSFEWADLPCECWELILRSLKHRRDYDSVSLVCKGFYSITRRLQSSLTLYHSTIPFLPRFFVRFPALKFIDLSNFTGDLNPVLALISKSRLAIDSLDISNQKSLPVDGLRKLGSKMRDNIRVLICSNIRDLQDSDLVVIADSFPLLEELDISFPEFDNKFAVSDSGFTAMTMRLKNLRRVEIGNFFITDVSLHSLFANCEFLREVALEGCSFLSQVGVASAILKRPYLISISLSNIKDLCLPIISDFIDSLRILKSLTVFEFVHVSVSDELLCSMADADLPLSKLILSKCSGYTYAGIACLLAKCQSVQYLDLQNAKLTDQDMRELSLFLRNVTFIDLSFSPKLTNSTFLALTRNCPLLSEIRMERTALGTEGLKEDSLKDFVFDSRVKTLYLGGNFKLKDEDVKGFVSVCPNLELLDINTCWNITKGVFEALRDCLKITHLSLAGCAAVTGFEIGFELPKLEVMNLSQSRIDDEALSIVSKTCCGLTHLELQNCFNVTSNGVRYVVGKCTRLRDINLKHCNKVSADIIPWMSSPLPDMLQ
ncbi:F-box/LRR-repeat protein 3-like [Neltuma alba]|uniref:F-box/LRR-repeat protein 3-like n=1 Tax=Neltuma alba TaxID=207710 RepID=UPI0010A40322|nr:F-box/LRR-repeat protein 3-like [Prosopis alba]